MSRYWVRYRSSITGRFVTRDYAEANPSTTIKQVQYRERIVGAEHDRAEQQSSTAVAAGEN